MKYLTIIRHAKSSWEYPDLEDLVRPINKKGIKSIEIIGNHLKKKKIHPDLIITSPATRAMQTAIGIGKILNYDTDNMQIEQSVYFGNSASILSVIKSIDNKYSDLFLFGHEPILSSFIELLTKREIEKFPTCAVYRIAFDIKGWNDITSKIGQCEFYVNAKLLLKK